MAESAATCPNCGAPRTGAYCGHCGQSERSYLRATREIAGEFLRETMGLDTRLARTLKALLIQPGHLTREWSADRRASWVSPVRLYLVVSIVFFFALSLESRLDPIELGPDADEPPHRIEVGQDAEMDRLYASLTAEQRSRVRSILESQGLATEELERHLAQIEAQSPADTVPVSDFERLLRDRVLDVLENPGSAWDTIVADLPIAMFLTLPLFAAWLKLMYRKRFYAEHLVFALHLHSFLFFAGTFLILAPGGFVDDVITVAAGIYYLLALHRVYAERWARTLFKFVTINVAHVTLITFGIGATAIVALLLP